MEYLKAGLLLFPRENFQQSVLDQSVITNPKYESLTIGDDAILLKWYNVEGDKVSFKVNTDLEIKNDFPKVFKTVHFPVSISDPSIEEYVKETDHIDINSDIRAKANDLVAGETDLFITTYKVGSWVKGNIIYDLNTMTAEADQKASWVFVNKKGVCDEITNLFIAMMRSVNVPARFVSGMVYSNLDNNFGNHGWAEVYFPGSGWVPFDVTFGQYGWIDPTHIKLDDSYDSGVPSVEYNWKSRGLEVKADSLEFKTEVKQSKGMLSDSVSIDVKPLKERMSFGSYMPVEVTVENLNDYYVPLTIFFTKAPELVDDSNVKYLILKPQGKKHIYTIIKAPADLEEEYIYTSEIEVKTPFGTSASNTIKYAKNFEGYSKSWAEDTVKQLGERENKFFFSNLDLKCKADKESYYSIEDANINCLAINTGNVQLSDVNICLAEECKKISLSIGEKKDVNFVKPLTKSEKVTITAENKDMIQYSEVGLKVVEIPDLQIIDVKPVTIDYYGTGMLTFALVTESPAYNVKVDIKNLGAAEWENITDKNFLKIPFEGKDFSEGIINVKLSYEDALKKVYTGERDIPILVTNVPSYVKAWIWFKKLF
ncbi:MAG: transglutaminase-like domain-containing protein [Nanoarchaeota archaeon]|nr:transglutaminase-like domain-containing protein [Nanoarchaeota archaeon]